MPSGSSSSRANWTCSIGDDGGKSEDNNNKNRREKETVSHKHNSMWKLGVVSRFFFFYCITYDARNTHSEYSNVWERRW
jgi:hypothetical protein